MAARAWAARTLAVAVLAPTANLDASWRAAAACRPPVEADPARWTAAVRDRAVRAALVAVCEGCPVRHPCLTDALVVEAGESTTPVLVRGGVIARERATVVRDSRRAGARTPGDWASIASGVLTSRGCTDGAGRVSEP
jgi:transcription factor WhiB